MTERDQQRQRADVERSQEELVEAATHGELGTDPTEDEGEQEEDRS